MLNEQGIALLKERRSVREYKDEIVSKDVLNSIMEVARFAPSWANYQIARYTFITNPDKIKQFMTDGVRGFTYNIKTLENAKNVCVLSFVKGKSGKAKADVANVDLNKAPVWEVFDAGIACQTFCLAAHAHGVGTCIMGIIDDAEVAKIAELPEEETVGALIVYGYPTGKTEAPARKEISKLARFMD